MHDADLEAAAKERTVAPAQGAVLGDVAAKAGHVVTPVVEQQEQPPAWPQDARGFRALGGGRPAIRSPEADQDVGRAIGSLDPGVGARAGERHAGTEVVELAGADPVHAVEQDDVAAGDRTESVEGPGDLGFHVEDAREAVRERLAEVDW